MASQERAHRLADRIKVIVAECLEMRIKDPRLGFITVTDTRVTADLREATVFYTVFGDEAERTATAAALESANGILRTEVGKRTGIKFTPTLVFILDALPDTAKNVDDLLARAAAADAEVHARAVGATFAGEADPYRAPRIENADDEDES
jgi:ribosome-binding factor A